MGLLTPEILWKTQRQQAGRLIEAVLDEELTARRALNRWPPGLAGCQDASLDSAYQALWHFESDETQQQTQVYYLDAQIELLKQMSRYLSQGKTLPSYLITPYPEEHRVRFYQDKRVFPAMLQWVYLALKQFKILASEAIGLASFAIEQRREKISSKKAPSQTIPQPPPQGTFSQTLFQNSLNPNNSASQAASNPFNSPFNASANNLPPTTHNGAGLFR